MLNTFSQALSEVDVLNPAHHKHIGVGLCILFFEVPNEALSHIMPIFAHSDQLQICVQRRMRDALVQIAHMLA